MSDRSSSAGAGDTPPRAGSESPAVPRAMVEGGSAASSASSLSREAPAHRQRERQRSARSATSLQHGDDVFIPFAPSVTDSPVPPQPCLEPPSPGTRSNPSALDDTAGASDAASRDAPLSPRDAAAASRGGDTPNESPSPVPPVCLRGPSAEAVASPTASLGAADDAVADAAGAASPPRTDDGEAAADAGAVADADVDAVVDEDADAADDADSGQSASVYDEHDEEVGGEVLGQCSSSFHYTITKASPSDIVGMQLSDNCVITHIEQNTPAHAAGLEPGMTITMVDMEPVSSSEEVRAALTTRVTIALAVSTSYTPSPSPSPRDTKRGMAFAAKAFSERAQSLNQTFGTRMKGVMGGKKGGGGASVSRSEGHAAGDASSASVGGKAPSQGSTPGVGFAGMASAVMGAKNLKKKAGGMLGNMGNINMTAIPTARNMFGDLGRASRSIQELIPIQGKTGDNTVVVSADGFVRAKRDIEQLERRRVDLAESRRKAEAEGVRYQTETQENQELTDKLALEYRKLADIWSRSRDPDGAAQLEDKIRAQEEKKESDLMAFMATQTKLKGVLKQLKGELAGLRERAETAGLDVDAADTADGEGAKQSITIEQLIDQRKAELNDVDSALARMEKQARAYEQAIQVGAGDQGSLADALEEVAEQQRQLEAANAKLRHQREQLQKGAAADAARHEKAAGKLQGELDTAQAAAEKEFEGARQALTQNKELRSVLAERLDTAEANFENLKKANKHVQREVEERKARRQDIAGRQRELMERAAELQENKRSYEQTEAELKEAEAKLEEAAATTQKKGMEKAQLEQEVRTLEKRMEQQSTTLLECEGTLEDRKQAVQGLEAALSDLEILETHIPLLEERYYEERSRFDTERAVNLNLMRALQDLQAQKDAVLRDIEGRQHEAAELETKTTALRQESEEHFDMLENMIREHQHALDEHRAEHARQNNAVVKAIQETQVGLAAVDAAYKHNMSTVERYEGHLLSQPDVYDALLNDIAGLKARIHNLGGRLKDAEQGKRDAQDDLQARVKAEKKKDLLITHFAVDQEGKDDVESSPAKRFGKLAKIKQPRKAPSSTWPVLEDLLFDLHAIRDENKALRRELSYASPSG